MEAALNVEVVQLDGTNLGAFCLPSTAIVADLHAQLPVEGRFTFGGRVLDHSEMLAALPTNDADAPLCIQLIREQSFALVPLGAVMRCSEPRPVLKPVEPPSAEPEKPKRRAIGISFGNTSCCVGIWSWEDDSPRIIPNLHGDRITPACVAFTGTDVLVGEDAWVHSQSNPENTLFGVLQLIGRTYDDLYAQTETDSKSFKYVAGQKEKPLVVVSTAEGERQLNAEEVSAMIFRKLKEFAEAYVGTTLDDAVITVPIHFDNSQRQMIKDAGALAGLNVLRILNEPTAAAIAYGLDRSSNSNERNALVYDMGGGTFNATALSIEDGIFEVKATCGNMNLGGNDFDSRILEWCLWDIELKNSGQNFEGRSRVVSHLRSLCERAKRTLSVAKEAMIEAEALFGGVDYSCLLSRKQFEDLNMKSFQKSMEIVETCLRKAGVSTKDVHDVVVVGGSTRIPKIRNMLQEMFEGKEFWSSINPEEVVALGAATQAAILTGASSSVIPDLCIMEVTPLSVGLEIAGGLAGKIIRRNATYVGTTCTCLATFTTSKPYQAEAWIRVFQGERCLVSDCDVLGEFLLPLSPAPQGVPVIEVVLDYDLNSNLQVSAEDKMSGTMRRLSLKLDRLSPAKIKEMVTQAERFSAEDELCRKQLAKLHGIQSHTEPQIVQAVEGQRVDGWWRRLDAMETTQTS